MDRKQDGENGERFVQGWLEKQGFRILAKNYRTRMGEVDLIAEKAEVIAFVEVKSRHTAYFPVSMVITDGKQRRIIKAAKYYLAVHQISQRTIRFDVATVLLSSTPYDITYIPNAFTEN